MSDIWDNPTEQNIGRLPLDVREDIANRLEFFAPYVGRDVFGALDKWLPILRDPRLVNYYFNQHISFGSYPASLHVAVWIEADDSVSSSVSSSDENVPPEEPRTSGAE